MTTEQTSISTDLVIIDQKTIVPAVLFTEPETLDKTLKDIRDKVMSFVPDVSTDKGRKAIASLAHKVAQSKTWLDGERLKLVADWKEKSKKVDAAGKQARDFLDKLKEEARAPLTTWETAEEARLKAEALAAQVAADWEEALKEDEVFNLKAEIARRDAENARIKAERLAREEAERVEAARKQAEIDRIEAEKKAEAERIEREKRIAEEAKAKAEADAKEAALKAERESAAKLETERIAAAQKIADERMKAQMEAESAERKRLADIKAAEEKAEAEKQAIIQSQLEKERKEAARIAAEKAANELRMADLEHLKKINNAAKSSIMAFGFSCEAAEKIVAAIAKGQINHVTINY